MVSVIASNSPKESPGFFRFRFQGAKTIDSLKAKSKVPVAILVYIKEAFDWNYLSRPVDKKNAWTPEDVKQYGNLTISRIKVLGAE